MMAAWRDAGGVCVLATVVGTRGSSYRSPGARMLILPDGSRIGAVSGGCLEGELCRRAHWWTSESPAVLKTFDTSTQEDNEGFGLGCGGGIDLLLERLPSRATATHPLLAQEQVTESREAAALALVIDANASSGLQVGQRFARENAQRYPEVAGLLERAVETGYSFTAELREGTLAGCRVFFESLTPPVQMLVCGAGTDAQPMVTQATALGWSVVVLDQRADFARSTRFPEAGRVIVAKDAAALDGLRLDCRTAAVVMSHSFAQDTFFLESLLRQPLGYLGVLGARRRTLGPAGAAGSRCHAGGVTCAGGTGHRCGDAGADCALDSERGAGYVCPSGRRRAARARWQHSWPGAARRSFRRWRRAGASCARLRPAVRYCYLPPPPSPVREAYT